MKNEEEVKFTLPIIMFGVFVLTVFVTDVYVLYAIIYHISIR